MLGSFDEIQECEPASLWKAAQIGRDETETVDANVVTSFRVVIRRRSVEIRIQHRLSLCLGAA